MKTQLLSMGTKTILLIDDDNTVLEIVKLCLKDLGGWTVLSVDSPLEGLRQAIKHCPDAIVLDFVMPSMNGYMFLEQLRKNPVTKNIPVVFLSSKARWLDPQALREYQVAGAIPKPFDPATLCDDIGRLLGWDWTPPNN